MRIKKIELIGFKSFAGRTEIHLGEGVTCIVGPNGCGKSNISDAIRWVFGERSAKLLRGIHMEDVIFNGTEFRKPLGIAEVSITIENEDRRLTIEYDEVVLTRRLDRSGQSEYFINRTACRLKDILDLILDTGMGSNSYSMIEQGRVDMVISADPDERRFLIEEAAGISKYKVKKEEALRKLERTEQNLLRIRDIVSEVQKNIQYAEKQAQRAERYKTQFENLKKLEIQKAFLDLFGMDHQIKTEETKKENLCASERILGKELEEIRTKQREQKSLLDEVLKTESQDATRCFELKSEHRSLTEKREFNQLRLQESQRRQIEIAKEQEILSGNRVDLEKQVQIKILEGEQMKEERQKAELSLTDEKLRFDQLEKEINEQKAEAEKTKYLLFENAAELARFRNEWNRLKTLLETSQYQEGKRKETAEKILAERKDLQRRVVSYGEELSQMNSHLQEIRKEKETAAQKVSDGDQELETLTYQISEKQATFQEFTSRLKLLQELEEKRDETERQLLNAFSNDSLGRKLVRGLGDVLRIEKGYEAAVEAVLGFFAQGLIAEDVETAQKLVTEMSRHHTGPCGIFIRSLSTVKEQEISKALPLHQGIEHSLSKFVQVHDEFKFLFEPLFEKVYVLRDFSWDHLPELLPLAWNAQLVTKQGILLGPDSRIFFRNGKLSPDHGPFRRQAEIHQLQESCAGFESELETLQKNLEEKRKEILIQEREKDSCGEREKEILVRREAFESLLHGLKERLLHLEEEIRVVEFEEVEAGQEMAGRHSRSLQLENQIAGGEAEEKKFLSYQVLIEQNLHECQLRREEQIQKLARLKNILENHEERWRMTASSEFLLKDQIEKIRERLARLEQESEELSRRICEIHQTERVLMGKFEKLEIDQKESENRLSESRGRRAFQEQILLDSSNQLSEKEIHLREFQSSLHELELKLMDGNYRRKNLFERLEQTYQIKLHELNPQDFLVEEETRVTLEEKIKTMRERVAGFGPVNILAVDEYQELKQRYDFLADQEKDLNEARESLLEAIRTINRTTKNLFQDTFNQAQTFFQEYFKTLFGGGHAELVLTQNEEGEEAGIDIVVRPPGKKLQHISLLSGGEKALTAMGLLFALFRIKPSPLCVLDEVDAPLDEANIDRFVNVLRTFLESSQFIIVTHNRKTIAMGDSLYGVTMQEAGVSKLVSVKVNAVAAEPVSA